MSDMSDNTEKRERKRDFDSIEKTIERRFESDSARSLCVCVCVVYTATIPACYEAAKKCSWSACTTQTITKYCCEERKKREKMSRAADGGEPRTEGGGGGTILNSRFNQVRFFLCVLVGCVALCVCVCVLFFST